MQVIRDSFPVVGQCWCINAFIVNYGLCIVRRKFSSDISACHTRVMSLGAARLVDEEGTV